MTISYAITACNEHKELSFLLDVLRNNIRQEDEIVIQLDSNATEEVREVAKDYIEFPLNKDFASFKQNLSRHCTKEYIFQIDADEIPHTKLLELLPEIIEENIECDVIMVPRINTVDGLTEEHVRKWGWHINERGWVNWPDEQWRIYKNNSKSL